ncbi:MAG: hypothetical protein KAW17_02920 [Candidatus Eisenbacteria sp.]|nr:hypothetical protein [Candidatus Eisenbacteria bacterium]
MSQAIVNSGYGQLLDEKIRTCLREARPRVLGIVSAFVTTDGLDKLTKAMARLGVGQCRLVAGTSHFITHPEALNIAKSQGWKVKLGKLPAPPAIFHPKLMVGGDRFNRAGGVVKPCFVCIGSANLTLCGLSKNTECSLISTGDDCVDDASSAFQELWSRAAAADKVALNDYAASFAEKNRKRSAGELDALGVSDGRKHRSVAEVRRQRSPRKGVVGNVFAVAAWAGLQSFTGDYMFQVEFPRAAGEVIRRLVGRRTSRDGYLQVSCPDDNRTCQMKYNYYKDNNMFRLNVPNDTKNVQWARAHHNGIALVERGLQGGAPIRLRILRPGMELDDVVAKSYALDSWCRTMTRKHGIRLYGWY